MSNNEDTSETLREDFDFDQFYTNYDKYAKSGRARPSKEDLISVLGLIEARSRCYREKSRRVWVCGPSPNDPASFILTYQEPEPLKKIVDILGFGEVSSSPNENGDYILLVTDEEHLSLILCLVMNNMVFWDTRFHDWWSVVGFPREWNTDDMSPPEPRTSQLLGPKSLTNPWLASFWQGIGSFSIVERESETGTLELVFFTSLHNVEMKEFIVANNITNGSFIFCKGFPTEFKKVKLRKLPGQDIFMTIEVRLSEGGPRMALTLPIDEKSNEILLTIPHTDYPRPQVIVVEDNQTGEMTSLTIGNPLRRDEKRVMTVAFPVSEDKDQIIDVQFPNDDKDTVYLVEIPSYASRGYAGRGYTREDRIDFAIGDIIIEIPIDDGEAIINYFRTYPLLGEKAKLFDLWVEIQQAYKSGDHATVKRLLPKFKACQAKMPTALTKDLL